MERQETERVTDRQVIKNRQKKFFAFCLAILIGCMPTVNVMAATTTVTSVTFVDTMNGKTFVPGDRIEWNVLGTETTGKLTIYYTYDGLLQPEETTGDIGTNETRGLDIRSHNVKDLLHWKVSGARVEGSYGFLNLEAVLRKAGGGQQRRRRQRRHSFHLQPGCAGGSLL